MRKLTFKEAVEIFNRNTIHFMSNKGVTEFINSISTPFIVEISKKEATNTFTYLQGDDATTFINFVIKNKPKYISRKLTQHGIIYEYESKFLWTPIDKAFAKEAFKSLFPDKIAPIGYLSKGSKMLFTSWEEVIKMQKLTLIVEKP